ncbi:metalloregulator ArsR/SmtB family transcription factor [Sphingopyxis sp.]|uniref:metalloregulator ArsR/SmtB family transcription factor n=1 Tax=Sphingopyxis sp. TaxID=1908224 RepID=UPI001D4E02A9|nr:metalloregulator ArsR/SmtB family transcription factor [Sphingopyxis sp.]MBW8294462.1 metalloregulator ArsR/SmtB family transcription factor [Sphingopyxis sp.]
MKALFESRAHAVVAADKLKVYAQPQRLMILSCLLRGEHTVSEIDAVTGIGQPALSQQLAELRRNELVRTRRVSKQIWYDLADDKVRLCVRSMEVILGDNHDLEVALGEVITSPPLKKDIKRPAGAASFVKIL